MKSETLFPLRHKKNNIIAVGSGKGGVGKSIVSVVLAQTLCQMGQKVLLFDGDLGLANIDVIMGLSPEKDISHVLLGQVPLNTIITSCGGVDVLSGHSGTGALAQVQPVKLKQLTDDLGILANHYDVVLVDLATGLTAVSSAFAKTAHAVMALSTPDLASVIDTYAFIRYVRKANPNADMAVVVNQSATLADGKRVFETIKSTCQSFMNMNLLCAGILRRDTHVMEALQQQRPLAELYPDTLFLQDMEQLARFVVEKVK